MGVSEIKEFKVNDIKQFLRHNNINDSVVYFVDQEYKKSLLLISKDSHLLKKHMQPLQLYYFNKAGLLISYHINCNAPGFPNLNWNYGNVMESFPPKTQTEPDSLLDLTGFFKLIKSNDSNIITQDNNTDFYIVVFWAGFLKRQSKLLIETVQRNRELSKTKKMKIIYVNTDNLFLE
jgi:hypothetical protein